MSKSRLLLLAFSSIALVGTAASAQTPATVKPAATKTVATKTVTTRTVPARDGGAAMPATARPAAMTKVTATKKSVATPAGRMVTTTTSTGKKITYDCGKPGNRTKAACK